LKFGAEVSKKPLPNFTIYNQSIDTKTHMGCTRYALWHISNIQNLLEYKQIQSKYEEKDPKTPRLQFIARYPSAEANGSSIQSALSQAKND
jgi:hypothetical protein